MRCPNLMKIAVQVNQDMRNSVDSSEFYYLLQLARYRLAKLTG